MKLVRLGFYILLLLLIGACNDSVEKNVCPVLESAPKVTYDARC